MALKSIRIHLTAQDCSSREAALRSALAQLSTQGRELDTATRLSLESLLRNRIVARADLAANLELRRSVRGWALHEPTHVDATYVFAQRDVTPLISEGIARGAVYREVLTRFVCRRPLHATHVDLYYDCAQFTETNAHAVLAAAAESSAASTAPDARSSGLRDLS